MKEFTVNKNDAGQRLDKFVTKAVPKLPLSLLQKYIRIKRIKVNDKRTEKDYRLVAGDNIKLYINDEFFDGGHIGSESFMRIKPKIDAVYEDENILLINKPKGLICHSDDKEEFNTLANHLKAYLYAKGEYSPEDENSFAPALCNRIDRNTEGIVIAAKNASSLRILNQKIKDREIDKYYVCLAYGHFDKRSGTLKAYLTKDPVKKQIRIYDNPVKTAVPISTTYKVLKERDGISLVEVLLDTGKTHQIRAHFAYIGHPLVGDGKYGTNRQNRATALKSQALCSYKLRFNFKTDAGLLEYLGGRTFEIPLPDIFSRF